MRPKADGTKREAQWDTVDAIIPQPGRPRVSSRRTGWRWANTRSRREMLTDRGPRGSTTTGAARAASPGSCRRIGWRTWCRAPQHPMTLGKVERFWATMWQEFLVRAQFDSFESARDRHEALGPKYYNHRRPHQGIGSLLARRTGSLRSRPR